MARKIGSHSKTTRVAVRAAAQKLIAQHGFAAVSMRSIAAEVDLQAGALYLYTPDKQTLLFDLMRDHLNHLLESWEAEELPKRPVDQLEHFSKFHIRYHLQRQNEVFVAYMELRNLNPENFVAIEELRHRYEDVLEKILVAGQASGDFKLPDSRLATMAIIAMLTGVNTWFQESGRLSQERVERIYWNMVRRAVGA